MTTNPEISSIFSFFFFFFVHSENWVATSEGAGSKQINQVQKLKGFLLILTVEMNPVCK